MVPGQDRQEVRTATATLLRVMTDLPEGMTPVQVARLMALRLDRAGLITRSE